MKDRCTGACCQDIGLYLSPKRLRHAYQGWYAKKPRKRGDEPHYNGIHLVYPMLVFLRKDRVHPESGGRAGMRLVYHYRCKHQHPKTGDCTIYPIRPSMCRAHGVNYVCRNPKCEWRRQIKARRLIEKIEKHAGGRLMDQNAQACFLEVAGKGKWGPPRHAK